MSTIRTTTHPLTGPTTLEEFGCVLEARRDTWIAEHGRSKMPPLTSWFYMPEDDAWIIPPAPSSTAPAAKKSRRAPECYQQFLDASEARLAEARTRLEQAQARAHAAGIPNDPGAHSGITRSTRAGRKHAQRTETARLAVMQAEKRVRALEATCARHRANLTRAQQRSN